MRERRLLRSQPRLWLFHLLALLPALAVTSALRPLLDAPVLALYLGLGLVGSLSWAMLWLALQQQALKPFREPGSFEELRSAPLSFTQLADGLALHTLFRALTAAAFLLVPLALGVLWVTPEYRFLCLGVLVRVLLILLLGVALASYLSLCLVAWSHGPRRDFGHLALLLVMAPMAGLLALMLSVDPPGPFGPARVAFVGAILLGGVWLARDLALLGLSHGEELTLRWRVWWDGLVRSARRGSSGWHRFTKNPVALREFDRENSSIPGGPLGSLIWIYGPFLMMQAVMLSVVRPEDPIECNLLYLCLLGVIVFSTGLRACARSQSVLSQDLEPGRTSALCQTSLSSSELVDGVALAAWLPRVAEALVLVAGTLPVAIVLGISPEVALPAILLTLMAPICLAYTGVASALEGSLGHLALVTHLCTWFSLVSVYSAAIIALRTWSAFETEFPSSALNVACLALWLVAVSVPYVLDTRMRALKRLQV